VAQPDQEKNMATAEILNMPNTAVSAAPRRRYLPC